MKNKKKALITTTTPYMIKQFLMNDIQILHDLYYDVEIGTNFKSFNVISEEELLKFKNRLKNKNIKIHQVDFERSMFKIVNHIKSYKQMKKLMDERQYDLVHTHTPISSLITRVAFKNSKIFNKCRMIYTAHGFHFFNGNNPLKNFLFRNIERYGAKYTNTLITINKEDYEAAKKFKLRKNGTVEYVPGVGIDIDKINAIQGNKEELCKELNIPIDSILLLSVGELSQRKNHEVVLHSLNNLSNKFHYLICGQGQLESYLLNLSKELKVEDRLHLLGYRTDIIKIMKSCDIFVFPSLQEGLPVALMEAMACGLICVVSKIRGNVDLIENEFNSLLCNPNDYKEFLNAIKCINEEMINNFSKVNVIKVKKYAIKEITDLMNKIYSEVLNNE